LPRLVIVNADDLGRSQDVNDAIFDLMAEGRISSATLMANGPALTGATTQLKTFPNSSFGVHLNLTQFEPVKGGPGARLLVTESGQLSRAIETASPSMARMRAIYEELCAQVDRMTQLGVSISHFDSHHHVHTTPYILPAFKAIQKRYGVRKVRISKNLYSADEPCPTALRWMKGVYNWALRNVYRTCTTDLFTELTTFVKISQRASVPAGSVELMVHPGAPDSGAETAVLRSDWLAHIPDSKLISYRELCHRAL
jgi:predicted glycoside hydrolase/deacetylase ChbG (UPF0249 family)